MSENSKIQWTDHTFNPWTGCTKVSPGCANCYAEGWAKRSGIVKWGPGKPRRRTSEANWREPVKWNRLAAKGVLREDWHRPRVFCASLADWLDDDGVPIEWLADLLTMIHDTPNLDWLLLTKRIEKWYGRIADAGSVLNHRGDVGAGSTGDMIEGWIQGQPPANVWIGTTVENQEQADKRIAELDAVPAAVRFLSCEPLLGPVNLSMFVNRSIMPECIDWVICGGESGPKARSMEIEWARSLRDQCATNRVAFFMKQLGGTRNHRGELDDFPEDLRVREFPTPREARSLA